MNSTQLHLTHLNTFEQFSALKPEWDALVATQVKTIFLTHDWLSQWWRYYSANHQLWILTVREGGVRGQLVGIVPLMLQHTLDGFRQLSFLGSGEVTPNHLDIIAQPDRRVEVLDQLVTYLAQTTAQWDVLELDKLPGDTCTIEQLAMLLRARNWLTRTEISARCPYVELPDSIEVYWQARGASTRRNWRRLRRQFEQDYPEVRFGKVNTDEELIIAFETLNRLHQGRWTKKGYAGAFSTEYFHDFHRAMALHALQTGQLSFYFLQVGSEMAAVQYNYHIADYLQGYLSGFDERWAKYSPGFLIHGYAIEQAIMEGFRRFDLLEGEEPHKQYWATATRDNMRLQAFNPHWRSKLVHARMYATTKLINWGVHYVPLKIRRPLWQRIQRLKVVRQ